MPLREDILAPVPGENPGGRDLRYDPLYDKIKEARREDDELSQGAWQHERKLADHIAVLKLTQEAIATQSKDLQLAAWLTESLIKREGYPGLLEGLTLCRNLIELFWDHLYPPVDEGDYEYRAAPLGLIGTKYDVFVRSVRLNLTGNTFYDYKDSRAVGYDDQAKTKEQKAAREAALKSGRLPPEAFDKAFGETPKAFYAKAEKDLDGCLTEVAALDTLCQEKFSSDAPGFGRLRTALEEVRHTVHSLLQKKREIEPDPVEEAPPEQASAAEESAPGDAPAAGAGGSALALLTLNAPEEPAGRKEAIDSVVAAAAYLRHREPTSPAPYLMLRGLRWGELRAAVHAGRQTDLEAPPTELRRAIKQLALAGRWADLIETAENAMALPCSRAWLDLQRFVVEACGALGANYQLIELAIQSELRALLRELPQIFELSLMDDTPAANQETQKWLRHLIDEPQSATPKTVAVNGLRLDAAVNGHWPAKFVASFDLALQAVRSGQEQRGFELLHGEIERQKSGRGRFEKRLQFVQLCAAAGKDALSQPMLDDLVAAVENHKLDEWEDREMLAAALATILNASKKIQGDAKEKQKMYERICRLNPVQALSIG